MTIARVADRYALDREVGRGASGSVWAANDEVLHRTVAIKRVGPPPGADASEAVRAEREARLAAQVNHPHVISVFDLIQEDDHYWLVMEYVDGQPLSTMIKERGALPPDEVAALLAPVADALAFAHELEIVHRDVKPSNILVRHDGEAKLTDFGIARAMQDASLTQTGTVTGSPAYLAPEVATGGSATPASDVWSFGASLFHALSGRPPYHRDDEDNAVLAVLYRIVHEEPPRLPAAGWLAPLLEKSLTHDPEQRPSMADVRDFLDSRGPASPEQTLVLPVETEPDAAEPPVAAAVRSASFPPPPPPPDPPVGAESPTAERQVVARPPSSSGRPRRAALVGAAVAAILLVTVLAFVVGTRGGDDGADTRSTSSADTSSDGTGASGTDDQDQGQTQDQGDGQGESEDQDAEGRPSAEELEQFAENYVRTAADDPDAGFAMLTPGYQERSTAYDDFWGPMSNPRFLEIAADPAAMTVTYTYRYDYPGMGNQTERVTLEVVQEGDRLLIADAR